MAPKGGIKGTRHDFRRAGLRRPAFGAGARQGRVLASGRPRRRPDLAGYLQPMGNVGQVQPVQANLRFYDSRASRRRRRADRHQFRGRAGRLRGADVRSRARRRRAGRGAGGAGSGRAASSIHISAIGASASSKAHYAQTQGRGRSGGARRVSGRDHPAAVDRVRARGPVLQPLCAPWRVSRPCCR